MKKLFNIFKDWNARTKEYQLIKHLIGGFIVGTIGWFLSGLLLDNQIERGAFNLFFIVFPIAAIVEYSQNFYNWGKPSWFDFWMSSAFGIIIFIITLFV